ncbi:polysaccharide pyruvyl transferase family protein [Paenibacillus beijingensis]|uniref:polysaccharide pyruvyl transferase family protein n=1 Tax=Paenibacillus beijingensis TaxID=1126833 RepID=UPI0009E479B5|nr:polysaccharide pyruvyl transferase family protein [Paenibacillus beijingensis]
MQTVRSIHPMDELKDRLRQILNVIPSGSKIYYIDYPVHSNGGDLLIMKGTEAFFKAFNIRVQKRYSVLDFPQHADIPKDHIIVLHGGGNFGDLYPVHQKLREKIIETYPNHRIVMLPQTIFYHDEKELLKTAAVFNKHKDVHLYVRDTLSYKIATDHFSTCNVYMSPDMAHQLWPIRTSSNPDKELLCFFRMDIEKTAEQEKLESSNKADYLDWVNLYSRSQNKIIRLIAKVMQRSPGLPMYWVWSKYTDHLVGKAVNRFSRYQMIQTSRLHGHILSCLLNKQNLLLDNSYGKNSNYYLTWTQNIRTAELNSERKPKKPEETAEAAEAGSTRFQTSTNRMEATT